MVKRLLGVAFKFWVDELCFLLKFWRLKNLLGPHSIFIQPNLLSNVRFIPSAKPIFRCLSNVAAINSTLLFPHNVFTVLSIKHPAWSSLIWRSSPCSYKYFIRKRSTFGALGFFLHFLLSVIWRIYRCRPICFFLYSGHRKLILQNWAEFLDFVWHMGWKFYIYLPVGLVWDSYQILCMLYTGKP